ncbi:MULTISPECIES: bifunctional riboflavin kinase/FAD synthetase [Clostridia]|uniref:bifunctional riboflavin kinase/FAD synthetase n=1 Tax=Clostridia TaxID=186801 RepID=UPI000EA37F23|nr:MULTISPECIES: bifunctional riboflavin kinase/FAD synthetase [Clostridia]NBJ68352.1 bifunctional riboflavin kinase/FAD synthetase [Roseburia sp. 1XD42-34]RKI81440.1 bifunctional riboflavin kinase/FAD synthetase [Clostridium sp. 1xD42-85]
MRTIELTYPHTLILEELPETVAAIGFFDGIHKGHQHVIKAAIKEAKQRKMESAVITFYPHPSVVLRKDKQKVKYITPLREKQEVLQRLGVERLYIITFNSELAALDPQGFIDHFIKGLHIKHLVAGFDFSYGHKGSGNVDTIAEHADGAFTFTKVDKVECDGEKISSTRIRKLLASGEIKKANALLGRPLLVNGVVVKGAQRGKQMGYPTANMQTNQDALLPRPGIYAVKIFYKQEKYEGMASLGFNPTFEANLPEPILEVHIFDYNHELYGEELLVEFHSFIREEMKFPGMQQLKEQIANDEKQIRRFFSELS